MKFKTTAQHFRADDSDFGIDVSLTTEGFCVKRNKINIFESSIEKAAISGFYNIIVI